MVTLMNDYLQSEASPPQYLVQTLRNHIGAVTAGLTTVQNTSFNRVT